MLPNRDSDAGWSSLLEYELHDVFFIRPTSGMVPPRRLFIRGREYERFLDYIYVPVPVEELSREQVSVVNALRLRLMLAGRLDPAHTIIKAAFSAFASSEGTKSVLEWGCGFEPINWRLPRDLEYICTDIDERVLRFQHSIGVEAVGVPRLTAPPFLSHFDLIISIFVFHFCVPREHIATMHRVLKPSGLIVANLYRRKEESRTLLLKEFERAGFNVVRAADPLALCAAHEIWMLSPGVSRRALQPRLQSLLDLMRKDTTLGGEGKS